MRIGIYQNDPEFGQVEKNVLQAVKEVSAAKADLIVLPELFNTGYQFVSREEAFDLAEDIPGGRTCMTLTDVAESEHMVLVFGIAEREGERLFNSAVVIGPEGFIGRYRKSHLFDEEKNIFDPGDSGFRVFDIGLARLGVMICSRIDGRSCTALSSAHLIGKRQATLSCIEVKLIILGFKLGSELEGGVNF